MTHTGSDYKEGIAGPGVFLWRFMIGDPWQGKGYGKCALEKYTEHFQAWGIPCSTPVAASTLMEKNNETVS